MPSKSTPTETHVEPGKGEEDVERLSRELKAQVKRAKDRISGRYNHIIGGRASDPSEGEGP